ncbi:MAG: Nif3-like dinuclear metal center hexameric protein [Eggerthellaceae bacterium]|nr:Nif3-like dinuclear metal center hexameric protein [Eggerthellaceae bacterium]
MTVGQLERALLEAFPAKDAMAWDRTGMLCGDPSAEVKCVAVALDANLEAVVRAGEMGANVLLTHHPAFLEAPGSFRPPQSGFHSVGSVVWEAISRGVALLNYHTALDVSIEASTVLPSMLGLEYVGVLDAIDEASTKGYGQRCSVVQQDEPLRLSQLAARCTSVFGRIPRVWGNGDTRLESIVTCTGSASDLPTLCLASSVDCLVCGEVRYHSALDASGAGLCIVELGHDVSELPLCAVLAKSAEAAGVPEDRIKILDQGRNWWTPEATRR